MSKMPELARRAAAHGRVWMMLATIVALNAWGDDQSVAEEHSAFPPVTNSMLREPSANDWLMFRRTYDSWGHSPLKQIGKRNVSDLRLVWSRAMGAGSNQATPLVYDGVMYLPNPSTMVQALDAASGMLIWEYRRRLPEDLSTLLTNSTVSRNIAIYGDMILGSSADGYEYALDAASGKLRWQAMVNDWRVLPVMQTSGPIVVDGLAISGRNCMPKGGAEACVITAHDARTGKEVWRTRTIPREGEAGDETWGGVPQQDRRHVGAWMPPSFDPQLNLLYFGTSVTAPAPKFVLGGIDQQHLYHNSTLALDPATGGIRWYYQHLNDDWDLDHVYERFVVELAVAPRAGEVAWINPRIKAGERRKVVTGVPGKTGIVYTLDARTGEFLWATPTLKQNYVTSIDGETGRVIQNPATRLKKKGDEIYGCPSSHGGRNWHAGSYSPLTDTMFIPMQNTCMNVTATTDSVNNESLYGIARTHEIADGKTDLGTIYAIAASTGHVQWKFEQRAATNSLLTTGGGLLFGGDESGKFRAFDQKTGEILWETNLGAPVNGYPIAFAVDGRQFIAVSTGGTALLSALYRALTPEVQPSTSNQMFVFALPEPRSGRKSPTAPAQSRAYMRPAYSSPSEAAETGPTRSIHSGVFTTEQAARGMRSLEAKCLMCHPGGGAAVALNGRAFMASYKGQSLADLFSVIKTRMPAGRPGSLSDEEYADIIAAILQTNGVPAGEVKELPTDARELASIKITVEEQTSKKQ